MAIHSIDSTHPDLSFESGHLLMGGTILAGVEINANSRFLTRGGLPWFPIMGEFHFARYPRAYWRDELLKMKAGLVTVVASYIFWNYHEEKAGQFNWSGSRDFRVFRHAGRQPGAGCFAKIVPGYTVKRATVVFPIGSCANADRRCAVTIPSFSRSHTGCIPKFRPNSQVCYGKTAGLWLASRLKRTDRSTRTHCDP